MRTSRRAVVSIAGAIACALAAPATLNAQSEAPEARVLTSLPATYAIASSLAEGTRIRVANVPQDGRPMSAQARYFERPPSAVTDQLRNADAVVTIGKLWREDPLFSAARAQNIRVVNIDATEPYSATLPGVALVQEPVTDGQSSRASLLFWLSPSNAARAAEIIAQDLARISPKDAERVTRNLANYRRVLFDLKQSYEARLAELDNVTVYALASDFVYLTTDLGIFVDGYFLKQEIEWTPADYATLRAHLKDRGIRVVIHKRDPGDEVRKAIESAGAKLVVLRTAETFSTQPPAPSREQSYLQDLEANLGALLAALR